MKLRVSFVALAAVMATQVAGCHTTKGDQVKSEKDGPATEAVAPAVEKVPVDLFVMSQCPYGVQAENILIPLAQELKNHVELRLFFVGDESEPGVPNSLHGENEVKADLLQICTMKHSPEHLFGLVTCMNEDFQAMPGNFDECAGRVGLKVDLVKACADGDEGRILLLESFKVGDAREVMGSPTIYIKGVEYDGPGTDIGMVRGICAAIAEPKPELCTQLPEPVKVKLTVITDKRCADCAKYVEAAPRQIAKIFPGVEITVLDYSDEAGKAAYKTLEGSQYRFLPAFLFEKKIQEDPAFQQLSPYMMEVGDSLLLAFDATFDPGAEICGNQVDDDNNGQIDCADKSCTARLECAKEKKKKLEVFVMSQCPYGAEAITSLNEFLTAFGKDVDFAVRFIASEPFPGQFQSLHGPAEVAEDLRQICAQKYYKKGNKFMKYLYCRAADYQSDEWEKCAVDGIKVDVLKKCSEGEEGRKLLSADVQYSESLLINGSPTWVANNRSQFSGISPLEIQQGYCAVNSGLKACATPLSDSAKVPSGACGQ